MTKKLPEDLVREEVLAMAAYHVADAAGMVKLDAMENPYPLPQALRREIAELVAGAAVNRYPNPQAPELKARLREVMAIPAAFDILVGNGSDEIIQILIQTLARPGAVVLAPDPTFVMYRIYALVNRMRYVEVPLAADFTLDCARMLDAIEEHRPALTFIAYPNNPTGNLYPEADVLRILQAAPGVVVLDEAYHAFAKKSFMRRLAEFPNLVVMRTLSKVGMAGLRMGYAAGSPAWISEFDKVRPPYNVNVLTQLVAEKLLLHADVLEQQAAEICAGRERLKAALERLPGVTVFASDANFLLVRVPDSGKIFAGMKERGVLVKNLHGSHPLLAQCLRITAGAAEENAQCLDTLRQSL
ncbi:MAG: histidinol-phosphate transaminase [Proteobacteria bacterium]|nr:histidinol-phosphate transaminase [Pseudomonadota bacterium]